MYQRTLFVDTHQSSPATMLHPVIGSPIFLQESQAEPVLKLRHDHIGYTCCCCVVSTQESGCTEAASGPHWLRH